MKKTVSLIVISVVMAALCGCGAENSIRQAANTRNSVSDVLESTAPEQSGEQNDVSSRTVTTKVKKKSALGNIDLDLTKLSSTVVYSEVFNMVNSPDDYRGKVVKMGGICSVYHDDTTGKYYYSCFIKDAAACCAQGIEFTLTADCSIPEDYPQEGDEIEVVGEFDTYLEDEIEYCTLNKASIVSLNT